MITIRKNNKIKTRTPITIAIPAAQKKIIKQIPRTSLQKFKDKTVTGTDWYNLCFRIRVAYELSVMVYEEETQRQIKEVYEMLLTILHRRSHNTDWWMNDLEYELVESGLDAMDQIEEETTRRLQLDATYKADNCMKQFIAKEKQ